MTDDDLTEEQRAYFADIARKLATGQLPYVTLSDDGAGAKEGQNHHDPMR
jgi:hypothetical protein